MATTPNRYQNALHSTLRVHEGCILSPAMGECRQADVKGARNQSNDSMKRAKSWSLSNCVNEKEATK